MALYDLRRTILVPVANTATWLEFKGIQEDWWIHEWLTNHSWNMIWTYLWFCWKALQWPKNLDGLTGKMWCFTLGIFGLHSVGGSNRCSEFKQWFGFLDIGCDQVVLQVLSLTPFFFRLGDTHRIIEIRHRKKQTNEESDLLFESFGDSWNCPCFHYLWSTQLRIQCVLMYDLYDLVS